MPRFDIPWEDNYIGTWIGEPSRVLTIRKVGDQKYIASLAINGNPVRRPWMDGAPATDMPAEYTYSVFDGGEFSIDLWPTGPRLVVHLNHESKYVLDPQRREALTLSLGTAEHMPEPSRVYCDVIGGLNYFVRANVAGD